MYIISVPELIMNSCARQHEHTHSHLFDDLYRIHATVRPHAGLLANVCGWVDGGVLWYVQTNKIRAIYYLRKQGAQQQRSHRAEIIPLIMHGVHSVVTSVHWTQRVCMINI